MREKEKSHRPAKSGMEEEIREILRAEIPRLLRLAERLTGSRNESEDITQEALLRAIRKHPDLGDPGKRRPWLTRILVNLWRDQLRARARGRKPPSGAPIPDGPAPGPDPVALAIGSEAAGRIQKALAGLPPLQRAAMILSAQEGLSVTEIARVMGSTPERVKANLWHARKKLRVELKDLNQEIGNSHDKEG